MTGTILLGIGGFYTVWTGPGETWVCRARGRFRRDGIRPMVGDVVDFSGPKDDGYIEEIHPRRNACLRPPIANLDTLVIVVASVPVPDFLLVDRLLIRAHASDIDAVLCVNKTDLGPDTLTETRAEYERAGYPVLPICAQAGEGLEPLRALFPGKVTTLAGQSGVGKSSILQALFPERAFETGDISRRGARGKHTTRQAELIPIEPSGFVADTPGFSLLELDIADPEELRHAYPELVRFEGKCSFPGCTHRREPDCAAREALARGEIGAGRMERYEVIYEELAEKWRNQYE